jgi:hypothetical protein
LSVARADGGKLQLTHRQDRYQVAVFTAPTPLRVGVADISVLLQDATTGQPLLHVPVDVSAHPVASPEARVTGAATTEAATNKLFRAAQLELRNPGPWEVEVLVRGSPDPIRIHFEVAVAEAPPPWVELLPWMLCPFVALSLLGFYHGLRKFRLAKYRPRTPSSGGLS